MFGRNFFDAPRRYKRRYKWRYGRYSSRHYDATLQPERHGRSNGDLLDRRNRLRTDQLSMEEKWNGDQRSSLIVVLDASYNSVGQRRTIRGNGEQQRRERE